MKRRRCLLPDPPPRSGSPESVLPRKGRRRTTNGTGAERRERLRQHHRPGARPAAAVRRREGLVQVDVHGVDAEVARPHLADDGVEVGAVAVEIGAGLRARASAISTICGSNRPQVLGLVSMIAATSGPSSGFMTSSACDRAVVARRHRLDGVAEQRRGRRIGAVRRIPAPAPSGACRPRLRGERRLDRHHAAAARHARRPWASCATAGMPVSSLSQRASSRDQLDARPARSRAAAADGCRRSRAAAPCAR